MSVTGCPCIEAGCRARAGERGFTKIMPWWGSPGWGDGSVLDDSGVEFGVVVPGMRPKFCSVKLRIAGLGLWMRWLWEGKGDMGIRWRGSRVGVTSWGRWGLEPGNNGNGYISDFSSLTVWIALCTRALMAWPVTVILSNSGCTLYDFMTVLRPLLVRLYKYDVWAMSHCRISFVCNIRLYGSQYMIREDSTEVLHRQSVTHSVTEQHLLV